MKISSVTHQLETPNSISYRQQIRQSSEFQDLLNRLNHQNDHRKQDLSENTRLHFSQHAIERMIQRGLKVTPESFSKLQQAYEKAKSKGMKEVAVLTDDTVFILNIKDSKVVTVMNPTHLKDQVVTHIDGLVFA